MSGEGRASIAGVLRSVKRRRALANRSSNEEVLRVLDAHAAGHITVDEAIEALDMICREKPCEEGAK